MKQSWLDLFFWSGAVLHFGMMFTMLFHFRWARRLPALTTHQFRARWMHQDRLGRRPQRVSVVLAARDEEARVESTIRRLLAQESVEIEVMSFVRPPIGSAVVMKRFASRCLMMCGSACSCGARETYARIHCG